MLVNSQSGKEESIEEKERVSKQKVTHQNIPQLTWNHQSGTSTRHGAVRDKHGFDWFWPLQWQTTRQRYQLQKIDNDFFNGVGSFVFGGFTGYLHVYHNRATKHHHNETHAQH